MVKEQLRVIYVFELLVALERGFQTVNTTKHNEQVFELGNFKIVNRFATLRSADCHVILVLKGASGENLAQASGDTDRVAPIQAGDCPGHVWQDNSAFSVLFLVRSLGRHFHSHAHVRLQGFVELHQLVHPAVSVGAFAILDRPVKDDPLTVRRFLVFPHVMRTVEGVQDSGVHQVAMFRKEGFAQILRAFQVLQDSRQLQVAAPQFSDAGEIAFGRSLRRRTRLVVDNDLIHLKAKDNGSTTHSKAN